MCSEQAEQVGEERLLESNGAVSRRESLVLEGLQLGGDVALGVLERLAAAIVRGDLVRVGVGDLDVEAVDVVVGDAKVGDAGPRTLALLELGQELARVRLQRAQLVELRVDRKSTRLNSSHL